MVLASAPNSASVSLLGPAPEHLAFRVCGSEHDGFVLRLRSPKCTVGSDPTCTLRLRSEEVHPFHCLILRGAAGTFVRRWSAGTTLNGAGFDVAPLHAGDRLRVGTVELEVLSEFTQEEVTPQPAEESSCLAHDEPPPDWRAEQSRLTEQTRELSLENERLRQAMESREEELRQAVFGHREQLESLRNEQIEQREMWRRDREQLELEFADSLAAAQSREQQTEAELRAIRAEVESWQQEQQQAQQRRLADAAASSRPMVTEPMPVELTYSTLALDPSELKAAALATAQHPTRQDELDVSPVADLLAAAPEGVVSAHHVALPDVTSGDSDENEIDRYMERLLRRVGNPSSKPDPVPAPQVAPVVEPTPVVVPVADEVSAESPPVEPPKRRESVTAEAQEDLVAMRELAQRSTRLAITHSDHRTEVRAMVGEFCVAGVCLVLGILAAALSRHTLSVETIGGALGISFGLVLSTRAVHRFTRLRKQSAGQSGHTEL